MVHIDGALGADCRPHGEELTLIGVGRWQPEPPPDPMHYNEGEDPDFIPEARTRAAHRSTALRQSECVHERAEICEISPDSCAVLARAAGIEELYIAETPNLRPQQIHPA